MVPAVAALLAGAPAGLTLAGVGRAVGGAAGDESGAALGGAYLERGHALHLRGYMFSPPTGHGTVRAGEWGMERGQGHRPGPARALPAEETSAGAVSGVRVPGHDEGPDPVGVGAWFWVQLFQCLNLSGVSFAGYYPRSPCGFGVLHVAEVDVGVASDAVAADFAA